MRLIENTIEQSKVVTGIIAGTPVDTQFGVDFLGQKNIKALGLAVSETPHTQTGLQALNRDQLTQRVIQLSEQLQAKGANSIMIYCNSLSGAIDLSAIRRYTPLPLVSPFDVYRELIGKYRKIGILAANCQSCAHIERFLIEHDAEVTVVGLGNLKLVEDIESGYAPQAIIRDHALIEIIAGLRMSGVEILILACTHFPYFYEFLKKSVCLNIVEPSERMVNHLLEITKHLSAQAAA